MTNMCASSLQIRNKNIKIGAASRTSAPDLAREMLSYLRVPTTPSTSTANPKAIAQFDYLEIYPGSKITHFNRLRKSTGLPFEEMLFFDDESRNKEVETLGVTMKLVRDGVTRSEIDQGVQKWRERHGRTKKED